MLCAWNSRRRGSSGKNSAKQWQNPRNVSYTRTTRAPSLTVTAPTAGREGGSTGPEAAGGKSPCALAASQRTRRSGNGAVGDIGNAPRGTHAHRGGTKHQSGQVDSTPGSRNSSGSSSRNSGGLLAHLSSLLKKKKQDSKAFPLPRRGVFPMTPPPHFAPYGGDCDDPAPVPREGPPTPHPHPAPAWLVYGQTLEGPRPMPPAPCLSPGYPPQAQQQRAEGSPPPPPPPRGCLLLPGARRPAGPPPPQVPAAPPPRSPLPRRPAAPPQAPTSPAQESPPTPALLPTPPESPVQQPPPAEQAPQPVITPPKQEAFQRSPSGPPAQHPRAPAPESPAPQCQAECRRPLPPQPAQPKQAPFQRTPTGFWPPAASALPQDPRPRRDTVRACSVRPRARGGPLQQTPAAQPLFPPEGAPAPCPPRRRVVQRFLCHRNMMELRWAEDDDEADFCEPETEMESEGSGGEESASEAEEDPHDAALDSVPPRDAPSPSCAHPHPSPPSPHRHLPYGTEQEEEEDCGSPAPIAPAPSPPPEAWSPPPAPRRCSPSPLRAVVPSARRLIGLNEPLFCTQAAQEAEAPPPTEQALTYSPEAVSPSLSQGGFPRAEAQSHNFGSSIAADQGTEPVPSDVPYGGKVPPVPTLRKPKERRHKGGCCVIS